jgi:acyl-CoA thioester hydrolase
MSHAMKRRKGGYFSPQPDAPAPLIMRLKHRTRFSDVDPMTILWHGRYANLFEQANEELGRVCGLSYADFRREHLMAPIVQFHVDYFAPVVLGENVAVIGKMIWNDAARIDIEYEIQKENGTLAAAGYTVQMFVDESGIPLMASPSLLEICQRRWRAGEFGDLK